MSSPTRVSVLSRSFSSHPILRRELEAQVESVRFNDSGKTLQREELIAHLAGFPAAIVALERIDAGVLDQLPDLNVISKYGVGLDNVDLRACAERGIRVGWQGGVNRRSVAELSVALMIASLRHVVRSNREILSGTFRQIQGRELRGRTVGLIGCGHVGKDLVALLSPFGCRVLAHDIRSFPEFYAANNVAAVTFNDLIAESDIVSLHVPFTPATTTMINADVLSRMREGAILINTARGGLVDEAALAVALREGPLSAAAFDVFSPEPPEEMALLQLPNFISTGHIGGSTAECVLAMGRAAIDGLFNASDALEHIPDYLR